ncbi:MAG: hypothetical protein ACLGPM_08705 [Acidobacteriota bacterium]
MRRGTRLHFAVVLAGFCLALSCLAHAQNNHQRRGRKYKAPPPSSTITVTVLKADNGKPIRNASVIFHPIQGDHDQGGMELKTDGDGKATIDVIPIGDTILLQIIAPGFQTYGGKYQVEKAEMAMTLRLNRPVAAYSIYKDHNSGSNDAQKSKDGNSDSKNSDPKK